MKFRKKPVVTEAYQFLFEQPIPKGVCFGTRGGKDCGVRGRKAHVHTIHDGQHVMLEHGDWILMEPDGVHFYPCKPDIFAATYESADEPSTFVDREIADGLAEALTDAKDWIGVYEPPDWVEEKCNSSLAAYASTKPNATPSSDWQPIETAPKSQGGNVGRLIDIWVTGEPGYHVANCYYDQICDEWRSSRPSGHLWFVPAKCVTHWKEVPKAPQPSATTEKEGKAL